MTSIIRARTARLAAACVLALLVWTEARAESVKIVALGASNAAGAAVGSSAAWPAQLERMLRAKGYDVSVDVRASRGASSSQIVGLAGFFLVGSRVVAFVVGGGF